MIGPAVDLESQMANAALPRLPDPVVAPTPIPHPHLHLLQRLAPPCNFNVQCAASAQHPPLTH